MEIDWATALSNLTSVTVLMFVVGVVAARLGLPVRVPEPIYNAITLYLLFGIGLKGGVQLRNEISWALAAPAATAVALGIIIPLAAYAVLRLIRALNEVDRASISAHYGSTSLVTFSAALVYLDSSGIPIEGFAATLLVILEIPGIIVGILLGTRADSSASQGTVLESIKEIFLGKTVYLLLGGLVVGWITGQAGYERVEIFYSDLLPGILAFFLLNLGQIAGEQLGEFKRTGFGLVVFAILFPLAAGTLGAFAGPAAGLSVGGATILAVLCASASYIAAPAAVGIALPHANIATAIAPSLGVTFPFNLIVGIPVYATLATFAATVL